MQPLEKLDSRIVILPKSAYHWTTYDEMKELGLVDDVTKHPWGEGGQCHFSSFINVISHDITSSTSATPVCISFACRRAGGTTYRAAFTWNP